MFNVSCKVMSKINIISRAFKIISILLSCTLVLHCVAMPQKFMKNPSKKELQLMTDIQELMCAAFNPQIDGQSLLDLKSNMIGGSGCLCRKKNKILDKIYNDICVVIKAVQKDTARDLGNFSWYLEHFLKTLSESDRYGKAIRDAIFADSNLNTQVMVFCHYLMNTRGQLWGMCDPIRSFISYIKHTKDSAQLYCNTIGIIKSRERKLDFLAYMCDILSEKEFEDFLNCFLGNCWDNCFIIDKITDDDISTFLGGDSVKGRIWSFRYALSSHQAKMLKKV